MLVHRHFTLCILAAFCQHFITCDKEAFARIRLPVCLLARLLKNLCMDLDEMLHVDRCRDMDEPINLSRIQIIVRMPEPDCFLRYCERCNVEFYYVWENPTYSFFRHPRRCSEAWF